MNSIDPKCFDSHNFIYSRTIPCPRSFDESSWSLRREPPSFNQQLRKSPMKLVVVVGDGVLNERHCRRLLREYVAYYHEDRTHLGLDKETPGKRPTAMQTPIVSITSAPRLGGLHHRYDLAA